MQQSRKRSKTIVQAILSEKPEFRYVVGSDAVIYASKKKYAILRLPADDTKDRIVSLKNVSSNS